MLRILYIPVGLFFLSACQHSISSSKGLETQPDGTLAQESIRGLIMEVETLEQSALLPEIQTESGIQ